MNLKTTYLGLQLEHPVMAGASPLGADLDAVRALEDAGAAAISILTEPEYFSGEPSYLTAARAALPGEKIFLLLKTI